MQDVCECFIFTFAGIELHFIEDRGLDLIRPLGVG